MKGFKVTPEPIDVEKTSLIYDNTKFYGKRIPKISIGNHNADTRRYAFFTCAVCGKQSKFRVCFAKKGGGLEKVCVECAALTGIVV